MFLTLCSSCHHLPDEASLLGKVFISQCPLLFLLSLDSYVAIPTLCLTCVLHTASIFMYQIVTTGFAHMGLASSMRPTSDIEDRVGDTLTNSSTTLCLEVFWHSPCLAFSLFYTCLLIHRACIYTSLQKEVASLGSTCMDAVHGFVLLRITVFTLQNANVCSNAICTRTGAIVVSLIINNTFKSQGNHIANIPLTSISTISKQPQLVCGNVSQFSPVMPTQITA